MAQAHSALGAVRFGVFEVDPRAGELRKQGVKVKIQEQPFQVLLFLLERHGDVVSREELRQRIWPVDTFVDFDAGLNNAIKRLRETLGDSAGAPRYVETLPKRGYRFIGQLSGNVPAPLPAEGTRASADDAVPVPHSPRVGMRIATGTGVILLLGALLGFNSARLREGLFPKTSIPAIHSLAVLPLQNLSSDPSQEYFAEGMTDALITELSRASGLKVISRTSVVRYTANEKSLPQIAKELNVDGLIEGTVQRVGNRVRITAQLIYGPTDQHLWANSYERGTNDVLELEEDLARAIAREIRVQLTPEGEQRHPTHEINLKALEAFLQGQYHREQASLILAVNGKDDDFQSEIDTAIRYFQTAVSEDPKYAMAYATLGRTLWLEKSALAAPILHNSKGVSQAKAAIEKAVALDPLLADAHMEAGLFAFLIDWDWAVAEREFKRAIELNANLAEAHQWYGEYLDAMGRLDEGQKEFEILQQLDPGNQLIPDVFFHRRQFDRVIELRRINVERHAYGPSAHYDLSFPLVRVGRYKEAVDEWIETMAELNYPDEAEHIRRGYASAGFEGATRAWVSDVEKYKDSPGVPTELAPYLYGLLGDKNRAFAALERAYIAHSACMPFLRIDPNWDELRSDPRFNDLVRRVGLP